MQIFIPTYGRSGNQVTLDALRAAGLDPILVVQAREAKKYERYMSAGVPVKILPPEIQTIAPTRQHILDCLVASDKFAMVDDDLYFYHRREDDPTKLRDITKHELLGAFMKLEGILGTGHTAHAGFAPREGANRNTEALLHNTRIMRVLGYDARVLRKFNIRFDKMEVMEDFHVALSLLELGFPNCILNTYANNQAAGSGAAGGCSHFRTPELHAMNARLLAILHPGLVKVTEKETKGAWGGGTRTDVIVYWKKAYAQGTQDD